VNHRVGGKADRESTPVGGDTGAPDPEVVSTLGEEPRGAVHVIRVR
jgi:hypothetical protein